MDIVTIILLLLVISAGTIALLFQGRKSNKDAPPSPSGLPIIGHLHLLGRSPHRALQKLSIQNGPIMLLRFGSSPVVVASNPSAAREFLKTHDAVFASRLPPSACAAARHLAYNASDLVLASYGEHWRHLRKLTTLELLTTRRTDMFRESRKQEIGALCRSLGKASGSIVDVRARLTSLTFNLITFMLMGKRYFGENVENEEEAAEFVEVIAKAFQVCGEFPIGDYFPYLRFLDPVESKMKVLGKRLDKFMEGNISEHLKKPRDAEPTDFLDVMLSLREKGDKELQGNGLKALMNNLISAGTDTSAVTLEWALAEIIKHPDVMKKAQEEVTNVVGAERMVEEKDILKLEYLHAVVKEVFRLHPAGPLMVPHRSMYPCTVMGYHVPASSTLLVNVYAIGRDSSVWENPDDFLPERFVGSQIDVKGTDFELLPFGSGRRMCPGMNLALTTVHIALANLIHGFDWLEAQGHEIDTSSEQYGLTMSMGKKLEAVPVSRLPPEIYS